ncbi:NPCBM/NEW2 domain-containing protein [Cohnella zeiphila]|uniref:NPCBM/NEW2 domain-containing protein n=1 Tax=Cohnella zeiphila TaxID=2761120 RepID=A0A7X0SPK5_9BACL|nr:NPCBM/NEW2 domain-containing protein [Cohnella zeiphila]MBB6732689.1 NPCBM/NEW2 domain-containing protein [Cohnella zeiphila]
MKDKVKGLVAGLLLGTMVTGGTIYAASSKSIEVTIDNFKFMVDGIQKQPTSGQAFIYQGTTFVPLRFAAEATGKEVQYEGKTKTIWIGKKEGESTYLSDLDYAHAEGVASNPIRGFEQFYINKWKNSSYHIDGKFEIAGETYDHGLAVDLGRAYTGETGTIYYNLDDKYSKLTGYVGIDDYTKDSASFGFVTIYGDDQELYKSDDLVGGNHAIPFNVNVEGVAKLKIEFSFTDDGKESIDLVEPKLFQ